MTAIMRAISRTVLSITSADVAKHALLLCARAPLCSCSRGPMVWI